MCLGTDYVAKWFAPEAFAVFCDRQKPNGQILEYIDMETGFEEDYGLNVADNTPLCLWGIVHHWQQYAEETFREAFLPAVRRASDYLLAQRNAKGLIESVPAGVETRGTTSWRNIIPGMVLAGEVTELNAECAMALRLAAEFTGENRYAEAARELTEAINAELWTGDAYLLNRFQGEPNPQVTGDELFPLLCGVASEEQQHKVLDRLSRPDFWNARGMRTVPNTDSGYDPEVGVGLIGGSWPNLTLWYAAAIAPFDPDRALDALERVARPVAEPQEPEMNVNPAEFAEWFHGDTGVNKGMPLSPWVAPTFVWAIMEGLLGLTWRNGKPQFNPHWPAGWNEVTLSRLPTAEGMIDVTLHREEN
jgi:glycogen debranching enzyme